MADGAFGFMTQNNNNLLVARSLASSVKTLLGPQHSLKCCTSDGEAVICSNAAKLLQFIDIQHPAGYIINDACQGQYKKYRTNCKTLICMAGFWSKAAQALQDQGVPVSVIVRLFDDALEACEGVCQEMSFLVVETLQSHHNSYPPGKSSDATIDYKEAATCAVGTCGRDATSNQLREYVVDDVEGNEDGDDDGVVVGGDNDEDLSWYFDGHIPEADSHILGTVGHPPGVYDHIPGVSGHIPGVHGHIRGFINMKATDESYFPMTLLQSILPETKVVNNIEHCSSEVSKSGCVTTNKTSDEDILLGEEDNKLEDGFRDASGHVGKMTPGFHTEKPGTFPKTTNKCYSSVELKDGKNTSNLGETCYAKHATVTPTEAMESKHGALLPGKVYEDEDEDEFEASFLEAVSNFTKENVQSCTQGFLQKAPGKSPSAFACGKTNGIKNAENLTVAYSKEQSLKTADKKIVNSKASLLSSGYKEREETDKLFSLLSEKLESKNKRVGNQVKVSEIYKGSRHFMNTSTETSISMAPSTQISSKEESYGKTETCLSNDNNLHSTVKTAQPEKPPLEALSLEKPEASSTSRTSVLSRTKTGRARKSGSAQSTLLKEASPTKILGSSVAVLQAKDEMKLMDRNMQLLIKLGGCLSHGKEQETKLAVEVISSLFRASGRTSLEEFEIHLNIIHTELILGPPSSFSQAINGLLFESTAAFQAASINHLTPGARLSVALVNGDVTPEFRHTGLNDELQIHKVIENKEDFNEFIFNQEKDWYHRVTGSLRNHRIGVLVAKGSIQGSVIEYCLSHNIVVLQNVAYPKLQLLAFAIGAVLVTYLGDLREQDIGRPVTIETWELGWAPSVVRQSKAKAGDVRGMETCQYVLVKSANSESINCEDFNSPLQTVLLCGPCKDILCDAEEKFWNSIYRLKNSLACGRVLPGAGAPEIACIRRLNELAGEKSEPKLSVNHLSGWMHESLEFFRPLVYSAFAHGFKEFLGSILHNSGKFTTPYGFSTYLAQLINTGSSLDFLGSLREEISENNRGEFESVAEITRDHARTRVPDFPTRLFARNSTSSLNDPVVGSGSLPREVEGLVWDDYTAKNEAWKRAVGIVRILLQTDMLVETGLERRTKDADLF